MKLTKAQLAEEVLKLQSKLKIKTKLIESLGDVNRKLVLEKTEYEVERDELDHLSGISDNAARGFRVFFAGLLDMVNNVTTLLENYDMNVYDYNEKFGEGSIRNKFILEMAEHLAQQGYNKEDFLGDLYKKNE